MSLYKRKDKDGNLLSPYWYCEWEDGGKPIRKSTGVAIGTKSPKAEELSKKKARQAEALTRQQYYADLEQEAQAKSGKPQVTFEKFTEQFLQHVRVQHANKPKTVAFYESRVDALLRYDPLKTCLVSQIDEELIAQYKQWRRETTRRFGLRGKAGSKSSTGDTFRRVKIATVNRDLSTLRRILNLARQWKYETQQPKVTILSGEESQERVITYEEEVAYLAAAPQPLKDFATIAIDTGMRPDSELSILHWEHVHLDPAGDAVYGYIHVPRGKTKNSKRNIPISERVRIILERRLKERKPKHAYVFCRKDRTPVPYSTIDSQHDRVLEDLPFKFRIYDLRHTFGTHLGESGADVFTIQRLMGHSNITVSQRYVHPTPEGIQHAFGRLQAYSQQRAQAGQAKMQQKNAKRRSKRA